mgnify:CR=1 FL=1
MKSLKASLDPFVHQFVYAEAHGPVPFQYPAPDYRQDLFAEHFNLNFSGGQDEEDREGRYVFRSPFGGGSLNNHSVNRCSRFPLRRGAE